MKRFIILLAIVCLTGSFASSCAGAPKFSEVLEKEWRLTEVHVDSKPFSRTILFDRDELTRETVGDIFTLNFTHEMIGGRGSPNGYSAPYNLGENQTISIMPIRSTLMASLHQPEKIQEHVFFIYMQNVYEWKLVKGSLELLSKAEDGSAVRLVFKP